MTKTTLVFFLFFACAITTHAQDSFPTLTGRMNLSVTRGTMECDFTLSDMPRPANYYIRLNSGMNIRYFKNAAGQVPLRYDRSQYDTLSSGEAAAYYLKAYNAAGKFLPHAVNVTYTGMYPVIADTASVVDWKGNIAFNGSTVRTDGRQTAWYPVLYDVAKDKVYDKVRYDIEINCADCKVIYVNGSAPVQGTYAHLKSDQPQELTLFAGNYRQVSINGTYFLNPDLDDAQLKTLEGFIHTVKDYFEKNLGIPYKGNPAYVQTTPVSKYNAWLFASYPTIVNIGFGENGLKSFVDEKNGDGMKTFMAHELGHYYFGTYRSFNSEMGDMLSEGFAEYLALNATRKLVGDSVYTAKLQSKLRALRNFKPVPFSSVRTRDDYNDRELYVYYYAPLIFTAIEKEIGEPAMWQWVKSLLQTPTAFTNYAFIGQTLGDIIKDKTKAQALSAKYFTTDSVIRNVAAELQVNAPGETMAAGKPQEPRKYFYYFISKPMVDAGSPENHTVKHTDIAEVTCTPAELSKISAPKWPRLKEACENEGGCSGDFNTYPTLESAQSGLQRWLKPFANNPLFTVKKVVL